VSAFTSLTEEELVELLTEERILRMAAAILKREKQHNSYHTCLTAADSLEGKAPPSPAKEPWPGDVTEASLTVRFSNGAQTQAHLVCDVKGRDTLQLVLDNMTDRLMRAVPERCGGGK
jgi:hypothetical protein